ncbi:MULTISPECIES: hypothetical protein [unclassified Bartonella]|nr:MULTISPECIES: hypothetical protein [unclassified Bartonella]
MIIQILDAVVEAGYTHILKQINNGKIAATVVGIKFSRKFYPKT